ncbi:MAG: hypothetical protein OXU51_09415 [Candidatus Poribacteria bacterium]|nr:hypothetical protein [Candidatus Poribacteria bacterium]
MNRVYVRTIAVLLLVAFASMGTLVLTDNFVPKAHADHGCILALVECIRAFADAVEACADILDEGITPECLAAGIIAWHTCKHAADDCFG